MCLKQAGLHLKRSKCMLMFPAVEYLGYVIDKNGLHPLECKIRAVKEAPPPKISELKAYLGLLTYNYRKFLPNLATTLAPLYSLFKKMQSGPGIVNK